MLFGSSPGTRWSFVGHSHHARMHAYMYAYMFFFFFLFLRILICFVVGDSSYQAIASGLHKPGCRDSQLQRYVKTLEILLDN